MCDTEKRVAFLCFYMCLLVRNGLSTGSEVFGVKRMASKTAEGDEILCHPEQVHISYSSSPTEMTVMWSTRGPCDTSVQYASHPWNLNLEAAGTFIELEHTLNNTFKFIHRTVLKGLLPSTTYYFRPHMTAESFFFQTPVASNESCSPNFIVLSSVDSEGSILKSLISEAHLGKYNAVLYNGDLEERLTRGDGQRDDDFLSHLEQAAGFVPFMTAPGRKAATNNLDGLYQYRNSFSMPGIDWPMPTNKLWYSFDVGQVHIISYSTDVLFESDTKNAKAQQDWIVNDLKEANKRRAETPWIIAIGSHPMYCSFSVLDLDDCAQNMSKVRHGLEDMFYIFAVDLVIEARHTMYERTWPQYKGVVITKSYLNPRAPVEVIIGSDVDGKELGVTIDPNATAPVAAEWSAFHLAATNSFGNLSVVNSSHLQWELISSADQSTLDSFWIVQDSHGNFSLANLPHNISHQINQTIIAMGGKPGTYDFISGSTGNASDVEGWSEYSLWLGLAVVGAVLVAIIGMVAVRSCMRRRRRARAGRRWREVDRDGTAGGNFYSVASESDTDDNDFEIDVYDKANKQSSKLLTSY